MRLRSMFGAGLLLAGCLGSCLGGSLGAAAQTCTGTYYTTSLQPLPPQAGSGMPQPQSQTVSICSSMLHAHLLGSGAGAQGFQR